MSSGLVPQRGDQVRVFDKPSDRRSQCDGIVRFRQETRLVVHDYLWEAAGASSDRGDLTAGCFQDRRTEWLVNGGCQQYVNAAVDVILRPNVPMPVHSRF